MSAARTAGRSSIAILTRNPDVTDEVGPGQPDGLACQSEPRIVEPSGQCTDIGQASKQGLAFVASQQKFRPLGAAIDQRNLLADQVMIQVRQDDFTLPWHGVDHKRLGAGENQSVAERLTLYRRQECLASFANGQLANFVGAQIVQKQARSAPAIRSGCAQDRPAQRRLRAGE